MKDITKRVGSNEGVDVLKRKIAIVSEEPRKSGSRLQRYSILGRLPQSSSLPRISFQFMQVPPIQQAVTGGIQQLVRQRELLDLALRVRI